jgi:hypothetical protein
VQANVGLQVNCGSGSRVLETLKMTHCGSGVCIAAVETMSILAAGEEPITCHAAVHAKGIALPVQSNGLLRQEIVD